MKRWLLLIVFLFVFLPGCSMAGADELGSYDCVRLSREGDIYEVSEIYPEGFSLELCEYGRGWLRPDGEEFYCRWRAENGELVLDVNGETFSGSIVDGVCRIQFSEDGLEHVFLTSGAVFPAALTEDSDEASDAALTERQLFWNGGWYGIWQLNNATGAWADQNGQSFDCFARIELGQDHTGTMIIWDELQSEDSPLAELQITVSDGEGKSLSGVAAATGGYFLDCKVNEPIFSVDPNAWLYDSFIFVENTHYEGENGSFDYNILLRPWGRTWEDVEIARPELLPYFYYDWYLPMLAAGESMPAEFIRPEAAVKRNVFIEDDSDEGLGGVALG